MSENSKLSEVKKDLHRIAYRLSEIINETPTGEERNDLCDIQNLVAAAIEKLEK